MYKYIFTGLKKTCLGVLDKREYRDKDNGTGLREERGIEMSTTVLSIYARSLSLFDILYLPSIAFTLFG